MTGAPEIWKSIPGYEGRYDVSDLGRVYSHHCKRILRAGRMTGGHLSVSLGRRNSQLVHHLVLIAFGNPRPLSGETRHLNDNPADNRLVNLTWGTRGENSQDKKWNKGQSTYRLTPEQVVTIKRRLREGEKGITLSKEFNIAQSTVSAIRKERFHRDVAY